VRIGSSVHVVTDDPVMTARKAVQHQYNTTGIGTRKQDEIQPLELQDVLVVHFTYILGNWKAVLTTTRPDNRIYEVTHKKENDGREITYIDTYLKTHSILVEGQ
jgi:hypothetical protein